jgi:hypothetical protein
MHLRRKQHELRARFARLRRPADGSLSSAPVAPVMVSGTGVGAPELGLSSCGATHDGATPSGRLPWASRAAIHTPCSL